MRKLKQNIYFSHRALFHMVQAQGYLLTRKSKIKTSVNPEEGGAHNQDFTLPYDSRCASSFFCLNL